MVTVLLERLPHGEGLPVPAPQTEGSAGADIASADDGDLGPGERRLFSTGFAADDLKEVESSVGLLSKPYRPQELVAAVRSALAISPLSIG